MERLGVLGAGRMGLPIVARLTAAGHRVTVFDVDEERMRLAAELGAATAISAEALGAEADVLISVLPGPLEPRAAMTGPGGALPGMRAAARSISWLFARAHQPRISRPPLAGVHAESMDNLGAARGFSDFWKNVVRVCLCEAASWSAMASVARTTSLNTF